MEAWRPRIKVLMTWMIENDGMNTEILPFCSYSLKTSPEHRIRAAKMFQMKCSDDQHHHCLISFLRTECTNDSVIS